MKRIYEAIPFALLIGLVPQYYLNSPNIAQSIIILAVSALCGYRLYCIDKSKPDYVAMFEESFADYRDKRDEELSSMQKRHEAAMVHLEAKIKELDNNYAKASMSQARNVGSTKFEF